MLAMSAMFGTAFNEVDTYTTRPPSGGYLDRLLGNDQFVALAAMQAGEVVGGLVAYELVKFEQERSEFYIYDLAVREDMRRRGVATALIEEMQRIAESQRGGGDLHPGGPWRRGGDRALFEARPPRGRDPLRHSGAPAPIT